MLPNVVEAFARRHLNGERVPDDLAQLLLHGDEFLELTGIRLVSDADKEPWNDTSYLSAQELENPGIASNVRAMSQTNRLIAFIAIDEEDQYYGYWRGPDQRSIQNSPIVFLDNEGQYSALNQAGLASAVHAQTSHYMQTDLHTELREFLESIGIQPPVSDTFLEWPDGLVTPQEFREALYTAYLNESPR